MEHPRAVDTGLVAGLPQDVVDGLLGGRNGSRTGLYEGHQAGRRHSARHGLSIRLVLALAQVFGASVVEVDDLLAVNSSHPPLGPEHDNLHSGPIVTSAAEATPPAGRPGPLPA